MAPRRLAARRGFRHADHHAVNRVSGFGLGATGRTVLNDKGDCRLGDLDFRAVPDIEVTPRWRVVARFSTASGTPVTDD